MRPRLLVRCTLVAAAASTPWSHARAADCSNVLVGTCINSDTLWVNPGPQRFATVTGAETMAAGEIGFGLMTTLQSRPVVLHLPSPGPGGSTADVIDNQINSTFLFAYGASSRLQLDVALPTTLVQSGAGTSPITGGGGLPDTAMRDLRFGAAYAIVRERSTQPWSFGTRFTVSAPTGDRDAFAGERTAVFAPGASLGYRYNQLFFGAEFGARLRPTTEFSGARIGTQLVAAAGAGWDILARSLLSATLEARTYPNFVDQRETRQSAGGVVSASTGTAAIPAEWMLAVRSAPFAGGDVRFFAGGGGPIPLSDAPITAPRFRFLVGASFTPTDADGDGVPNRRDPCPDEPNITRGDVRDCPRRGTAQ